MNGSSSQFTFSGHETFPFRYPWLGSLDDCSEPQMIKEITTSPFETVPVVVFQRLDVDTKEPISLHTIIFESAEDARNKADWISRQNHLALVGATDATFAR